MNKSLYMTQKSDQVKERIKIGIDNGLNEVILAKHLGVSLDQARLYIKRAFNPNSNYKLPSIRKLHQALNELGIENEKYKDVLQGLKQE